MRFFVAVIGLCAATSIQAADTKLSHSASYLAANCFNCHGTEGKAISAIPAIAGRDREFLEQTLKAFKAGEKSATIMHQLAKGYTDEELAILAEYFSRQK